MKAPRIGQSVALAVDIPTPTGRFYAHGATYLVKSVTRVRKGTPRLALSWQDGTAPTATEGTFFVDADFVQ